MIRSQSSRFFASRLLSVTSLLSSPMLIRGLLFSGLLFSDTNSGVTISSIASAAEPQIYRSVIRPNWHANNDRFWYRNDFADGKREFILVDSIQGSRAAAFDHKLLAAAMSKELGEEILADSLPIRTLDFDDVGNVQIRGGKGDWTFNTKSHELKRGVHGNLANASLELEVFSEEVRSGGNSRETEIIFDNRLAEVVVLHWIDSLGTRREYATLVAGEQHSQHTFASHAWLVTRKDGSMVGVFVADEKPATAVIDGRKPERASPTPRRRGRDRRSNRESGLNDQRSPDGKFEVFHRKFDLWLREVDSKQEFRLTGNGSATHTWHRDHGHSRGVGMQYDETPATDERAEVHWAPDSKKFVAIRTRTAAERRVTYVEAAPKEQLQPVVHSYPYFKPGDEIPIHEPHLFDVENKKEIEVDHQHFANPFAINRYDWSSDSSRFRFLYNQRGHQVLRVIDIDASSGDVSLVVDEQSKTFIDYAGKFFYHTIHDSDEIIWMSERSGWNHLYLLDAKTGVVKNEITQGDWCVRGVESVDEPNRQIYFRAGGEIKDQSPYHEHFYRVDFDGSNFVRLTDGDGTHRIEYSPDRRLIIDQYSRVDLPPVHTLRRVSDGSLICELESSEVSEIFTAGYRLPERFVAAGRDGSTKIYGMIHFPIQYDREQTYPVIENIYAGPHAAHVPTQFRRNYRHQQEIADRGFMVVQIDGMGTSYRSKSFHDVCWQNLGDAGFPDRIAWIQAAAKQFPSMDISKVGIYGGSAGGQNSLRALLAHGDFYKVAVSDCGCHDNRMDKIWWNELFMGWPIGPHYEEQSNVTQSHKLTGNLLLVVGAMDRNVDPASTMQVVDALIKADKDFDLLVVPNGGHGIAESDYGRRRRADFFARHMK